MRLTVSPKTAIQKIDALVREGAVMRAWFADTYEKVEEEAKAERQAKQEARERRRDAIRRQPDSVEIDVLGTKMAMPNLSKLLAPSFTPSATDYLPEDTEAARRGMKKLRERFQDWRDRTKATLEGIFMDFSPVYSFLNSYGESVVQPTLDADFREYVFTKREIQAKVNTLIGFYNALVTNIRSPLFYLSEQATLCFYDLVCPLKADTNEATLCTFLFKFSIGEKVEMADAHGHITGDAADTFGAEEKKIVGNAYDGINRKTNEAFGFPIIRKEGSTLCLALPSRITSNFA